jgi:hypothetical protein
VNREQINKWVPEAIEIIGTEKLKGLASLAGIEDTTTGSEDLLDVLMGKRINSSFTSLTIIGSISWKS